MFTPNLAHRQMEGRREANGREEEGEDTEDAFLGLRGIEEVGEA